MGLLGKLLAKLRGSRESGTAADLVLEIKQHPQDHLDGQRAVQSIRNQPFEQISNKAPLGQVLETLYGDLVLWTSGDILKPQTFAGKLMAVQVSFPRQQGLVSMQFLVRGDGEHRFYWANIDGDPVAEPEQLFSAMKWAAAFSSDAPTKNS